MQLGWRPSNTRRPPKKADAELKALKVTSGQHEARVVEVQKELKEAAKKFEALEKHSKV